jgi:hypothetical protein
VPFVHWASYERSRLRMYVRRFGDRGGVAGRVERNLLDLLPVTRELVALPLPSYGLKVVEKYVANEYQPPYRSESRNEGNGENSELVADQDVSSSMRRSAESDPPRIARGRGRGIVAGQVRRHDGMSARLEVGNQALPAPSTVTGCMDEPEGAHVGGALNSMSLPSSATSQSS